MDTEQKTFDLLEAIKAAQRLEHAKLAKARANDPYQRKRRKFHRGSPNNPRHAMREYFRMGTIQAVNAQQQIEKALRANGSSWRELEKTIQKLHKGKWSQIEVAVRGLLPVAA